MIESALLSFLMSNRLIFFVQNQLFFVHFFRENHVIFSALMLTKTYICDKII